MTGLLLIPTLILHNPNILCNFARKYGDMDIPHLYSIQEISVTYSTGDAFYVHLQIFHHKNVYFCV